MTHWSFQPIGDSLWIAAGLTAALLLLLLLGPRFRSLSRRRRAVLTGLRLAVVLLVAAALLRPTLVTSTSKRQSAAFVVLLDQSRSMQLPDAAGKQSRWQAEQAALDQCRDVLKDLAAELQVKVYAFDSRLHPLKMNRGRIPWPPSPEGRQTDIGACLEEAVRRERGQRLAGAVLLSDGAQTAYDPQVETLEAARELARRGVPLYTVAFGPPGDAAQARDVAIESLPEQYAVFVKNELSVQGVLRVRGYVNKDIPVQLIVEDAQGRKKVAGLVVRRAQQDNQPIDVQINYQPQQPGQYKLTLRAAEQPGELAVDNNQLSAFLTVLEGGIRTLYLEGQLRWEQKFLRRSIDASPDIELDFLWIDPRTRDRWPVVLGDAIRSDRYDAFILGDLDSSALGEANLKDLAAAVGRGKGLVALGGYHSFGAGGYRTTPLADVLPIEMGRFERQDFDGPIRQDLHLQGPLPMIPEGRHPITRLAPGAENKRLWQTLPPLEGANRFFGVKKAPGVRVIAAAPGGQPLLVTGEYGQGRVLAMAGDSTYLWPLAGRRREHQRFWRQVILWLTGREDQRKDEVWVKLPRRRFQAGARVPFTAGARSAAGDPLPHAQLTVRLLRPDGAAQPLPLTQQDDQWSGVVEKVQAPGDYSIEVEATSDSKRIGAARARFEVLDRDLELANPAADPDQMARLASLTQEAGGRRLAPEQLESLLRQIQRQPPKLEIDVQTRWQLADTAWDAWLFLLLLTALLTCEWTLRKKWGLV